LHLHDSVLRSDPVGALPREEGLCFKTRDDYERRVKSEGRTANTPGRPSATTRCLMAGRSSRRWPGGRWRGSRRQRAWRTWSAARDEEGQSRIGFGLLNGGLGGSGEQPGTGTRDEKAREQIHHHMVTRHPDTGMEWTAIVAASIHCVYTFYTLYTLLQLKDNKPRRSCARRIRATSSFTVNPRCREEQTLRGYLLSYQPAGRKFSTEGAGLADTFHFWQTFSQPQS